MSNEQFKKFLAIPEYFPCAVCGNSNFAEGETQFCIKKTADQDQLWIHRECVRKICSTAEHATDAKLLTQFCEKHRSDGRAPSVQDSEHILQTLFPSVRTIAPWVSKKAFLVSGGEEPRDETCYACARRGRKPSECVWACAQDFSDGTFLWFHKSCLHDYCKGDSQQIKSSTLHSICVSVFGKECVTKDYVARKLRKWFPGEVIVM